jgi:hypothetical protein
MKFARASLSKRVARRLLNALQESRMRAAEEIYREYRHLISEDRCGCGGREANGGPKHR